MPPDVLQPFPDSTFFSACKHPTSADLSDGRKHGGHYSRRPETVKAARTGCMAVFAKAIRPLCRTGRTACRCEVRMQARLAPDGKGS